MSYTLRKINATLKKLNENWNDNYWLFTAGGELHLMKLDPEGNRMVNRYQDMNQKAILHSYPKIVSDGGDW